MMSRTMRTTDDGVPYDLSDLDGDVEIIYDASVIGTANDCGGTAEYFVLDALGRVVEHHILVW
jgi:hypothetical protein